MCTERKGEIERKREEKAGEERQREREISVGKGNM